MRTRAKEIFWNAMLLTVASLFMRTVGVTFQVVVSGRVGAEAMGLFSILSGVYGFALTLATSGIHLGVTRMTVEAMESGNRARVGGILRRATAYALFFGTLSSVLLFSLAKPIGLYWLKDARTISSLRLLAITLPLIALSSAWGGYFSAMRRPWKNATVQVFEQAIKIGVTLYLLAFHFAKDVESACRILVLGGAAAEVFSFLLEWLLYQIDTRNHLGKAFLHHSGDGKRLLSITLPIAATTYIRSGLLTLQHILIPEGLRQSGASHAAALVAYGTIQSMALPVILYPAALMYSFSGLLVPELAEAEVHDRRRHIHYMISRVWSLSLLFSLGVAGVLICFSGEIGAALYPNSDAGYYIHILAPLIPIMYLDTATDAMMKGLGEQLHSMKINIADAAISLLLVLLLVPRFGIFGYIITIYISELFNTVCSITHLLMISKTPVRLCKWVYKPLFCIVLSTVAVRFLLEQCTWHPQSAALSIILHILAVILLYVLLLRLTRAVEKEDVAWVKQLFRIEKRSKHTKELRPL
ncbi:MAG: polysaccharide biosynthesis C-terminal domain-containing protein [Clostridia bacterium]|nr:polysaccharide biosynthesis C-terminal domain-containing protein [Clostridia bacterium]